MRRQRGRKEKSEQNDSRGRSSRMTAERVQEQQEERNRRVSNVVWSLRLCTFSVSLIGSHSMRQQVMGQLQQLMAQTNLYGYRDIITSDGIRETHTVCAVINKKLCIPSSPIYTLSSSIVFYDQYIFLVFLIEYFNFIKLTQNMKAIENMHLTNTQEN